ncbi:glycosyltransferase family 1 protein [Cylindrobasidium torrendii FP15055 ss-10]|uniref:Glycosyltransferase family 1 protein n=1 Tax=Cylindrobasidium torrendii FP15055 ss-10 TaxID=1314674 RepID=A0A0D7AU96_9AGAR|nr:glycosyltransferase family 1 protein [Cylindrobasidium torrendii FP15055 ss-10]
MSFRKYFQEQIHSAGLDEAPLLDGNLVIETFQETDMELTPLEQIGLFFSPTALRAVAYKALDKVTAAYGADAFKAIIIDMFFAPLFDNILARGLKLYSTCTGASTYYDLFSHVTPDKITSDPEGLVPIAGFVGKDGRTLDVRNVDCMIIDNLQPHVREIVLGIGKGSGVVFGNTSTVLEGEMHRNALKTPASHLPAYYLGPLSPDWFLRAADGDETAREKHIAVLKDEQLVCTRFLDAHPPRSVLFFALGSNGYLSEDQLRQVYDILQRLEIPTILVNRSPRFEVADVLPSTDPSKFLAVRWAPQLDVLVHPSIRVAVNHAGCGSFTEALLAGIPMICSPTFADQFFNAKWMYASGFSFGQLSVNLKTAFDHSKPHPTLVDEKELERLFRLACTKDGEAEYTAVRESVGEIGYKLRRAALDKDGEKSKAVEALKKALLSN